MTAKWKLYDNQTVHRHRFNYSNTSTTRRPASADMTAHRQFQATGQPVSQTQASDAMTSQMPRYEAKYVCNAGASNAGRSLCIQISRERSYPLPIYWYHSKGNWLPYNYDFSSSIVEIVQKTTNLGTLSPLRRAVKTCIKSEGTCKSTPHSMYHASKVSCSKNNRIRSAGALSLWGIMSTDNLPLSANSCSFWNNNRTRAITSFVSVLLPMWLNTTTK